MPRVKPQRQFLCCSQSSLKHKDNKVPQLAMNRCEYPGCSFKTLSRGNLKIHMKIHTRTKDQVCTWPGPENPDGVCNFCCTDPSSLNRHIKRHKKRAKGKGQTVPQEFLTPRTPKQKPSSDSSNRDPYPDIHMNSGSSEAPSAPLASSSTGTHVSSSHTDFGSDVNKVTSESQNVTTPGSSPNVLETPFYDDTSLPFDSETGYMASSSSGISSSNTDFGSYVNKVTSESHESQNVTTPSSSPNVLETPFYDDTSLPFDSGTGYMASSSGGIHVSSSNTDFGSYVNKVTSESHESQNATTLLSSPSVSEIPSYDDTSLPFDSGTGCIASSSGGIHVSSSHTGFGSDVNKVASESHEYQNATTPSSSSNVIETPSYDDTSLPFDFDTGDTQSSFNVGHFYVDVLSSSTWSSSQAAPSSSALSSSQATANHDDYDSNYRYLYRWQNPSLLTQEPFSTRYLFL